VIAPLLVVAFETLLNTSKQLVTRQFEERVPAVTEEAGAPLSKALYKKMYDARSRCTGSGYPCTEGPTSVRPMMSRRRRWIGSPRLRALRAVLRCCIEDADFRSHFASNESVRSRSPVTV
jgi:hypothetical protein